MPRSPFSDVLWIEPQLTVEAFEASTRNRLAGRKSLTIEQAFELLVRFNGMKLTKQTRWSLSGLLFSFGYCLKDGVFHRVEDWPEDRTAGKWGELELVKDCKTAL